jgi:hypothetical protein
MRYKDTDLAWAAGFIEGEGCLAIERPPRCTAQVTVSQLDKAPLVKLQNLFGGQLRFDSKKEGGTTNPRWVWRVSTVFCREVLPLLVPYMTGSKQKQAKVLSEFAASMLDGQHGRRVSEKEIQRRFAAKEKLERIRQQTREKNYALSR